MVDEDLWREYLVEAEDLLATVEQCALELEGNPSETTAVDEIFRCVHTLKGNSAFLGLQEVSALCHEFESSMEELRKKQRHPAPEELEAILELVDTIRRLHAEARRAKSPITGTPAGGEPDDTGDAERRYLVFSLGGLTAAVPVGAVDEVSRPLPVSRVPCASRWLRGLVNLRGEVIPIVDFCAVAGLRERDAGFLLVVDAAGTKAAIEVEEIHGVIALVPQPHEDVPAGWLPLFSAVARGPSGLVGIIETSVLLDVGVGKNAGVGG
ncbi:MAG: chemotaxis protein CheW [Bacillota bacterium]